MSPNMYSRVMELPGFDDSLATLLPKKHDNNEEVPYLRRP